MDWFEVEFTWTNLFVSQSLPDNFFLWWLQDIPKTSEPRSCSQNAGQPQSPAFLKLINDLKNYILCKKVVSMSFSFLQGPLRFPDHLKPLSRNSSSLHTFPVSQMIDQASPSLSTWNSIKVSHQIHYKRTKTPSNPSYIPFIITIYYNAIWIISSFVPVFSIVFMAPACSEMLPPWFHRPRLRS